MILEALGIPDNLLDLAEQVYFDLINEITKYRDIEHMMNHPLTINGDFNISDYNFSEIKIRFKFYDYDSLELVGMSYNLGNIRVKDIEFLVQESDFNEVDLGISFAVDEDTTPAMITQYIISNRDSFISSIAHELKHSYDSFKKPSEKLVNRVDYNTYKKSFGDIKPLNELLFNLYFTHQIENLVRPTEFASLVRENKVTKEQFLNFLTNTKIFKQLDSARKFNYNDLKEDLKDYLPEIEEIIDEAGGDLSEFTTEEELIDEILRLFYINTVNWGFDYLKDALISNPFEALFGISPEKENFIEKYYKSMTKYENNLNKFYNIHEKHLKRVSNDMIKKLGKVYAYIKDEKDLKNESIINPDIWHKLKENKGKISNKFIQ